MSVVFNGAGSLVTPTVGAGVRRAIFSSTSTTPAVVSTVSAHGFNTGDTVFIEGHSTNTAVDGLGQITFVDSKHFSVNGSVGVGVGGSTGYAIDYELQPAIVLPAGGELVDPGVMGAVLEGLANTAPYLYSLSGKYRLYNVYTAGTTTIGAMAWAAAGASNTSMAFVTNSQNLLGFLGAPVSGGFVAVSPPQPCIQTGDVLDITYVGAISISSASSTNTLALSLGLSIVGFAGGAYQTLNVLGGGLAFGQTPIGATTTSTTYPIMLSGSVTIPNLGSTVGSLFDVGLLSANQSASPAITFQGIMPYTVVVKHYRPN